MRYSSNVDRFEEIKLPMNFETGFGHKCESVGDQGKETPCVRADRHRKPKLEFFKQSL
jgi:hypothetical protein